MANLTQTLIFLNQGSGVIPPPAFSTWLMELNDPNGQAGQGYGIKAGTTNGNIYWNIGLPWSGVAVFVREFFSSFQTPDSVENSILGDIDLRCLCLPDLWASGVEAQAMINKWDSGNFAYAFQLDATGKLTLETFLSGGGTSNASSVSVPFANGTAGWCRVTRAAATGDVIFYTSLDGLIWVQLGTVQTSTATGIKNTGSPLVIGSRQSGSSSAHFDGDIYRAQVFNGINGSLVVDMNPADWLTGGVFDSNVTGEVWTINAPASIVTGIGGVGLSTGLISTDTDGNLLDQRISVISPASNVRVPQGLTLDSSDNSLVFDWVDTSLTDPHFTIRDTAFAEQAQAGYNTNNISERIIVQPIPSGWFGGVQLSTIGSGGMFDMDAMAQIAPLGIALNFAVGTDDGRSTCFYRVSGDMVAAGWVEIAGVKSAFITTYDPVTLLVISENQLTGVLEFEPIVGFQDGTNLIMACVVDGVNSGLLKTDGDGSTIAFSIQETSGALIPKCITVDADNFIYVGYKQNVALAGGVIIKFDGTTGAQVWARELTNTQNGETEISSLGINPADGALLFMADWEDDNGEFHPLFGKLPPDGSQTGLIDGLRVQWDYKTYSASFVAAPLVSAPSSVLVGFITGLFASVPWTDLNQNPARLNKHVPLAGAPIVPVAWLMEVDDSGGMSAMGYGISSYGFNSTNRWNVSWNFGAIGTMPTPAGGANLGSRFATPDSPANTVTGSIDLRAFIDPAAWGGITQTIISKWQSNSTKAFEFVVDGSNFLKLDISTNGSSSLSATSSLVQPFPNGTGGWVRVIWNHLNKQVNFYTSANGVIWTQLGTQQSINQPTIFASTSELTVGASFLGQGSGQLVGDVYVAQVYSGIDGVLVAEWNSADWISGNTLVSSLTGETWTTYVNATIANGLDSTAGLQTGLLITDLNGNITADRTIISSPSSLNRESLAMITDGSGNTISVAWVDDSVLKSPLMTKRDPLGNVIFEVYVPTNRESDAVQLSLSPVGYHICVDNGPPDLGGYYPVTTNGVTATNAIAFNVSAPFVDGRSRYVFDNGGNPQVSGWVDNAGTIGSWINIYDALLLTPLSEVSVTGADEPKFAYGAQDNGGNLYHLLSITGGSGILNTTPAGTVATYALKEVTGDLIPASITVDSAGNTYLGYTRVTVGAGAVIVKIDAAGSFDWARELDNAEAGNVIMRDLGIDATDGNLLCMVDWVDGSTVKHPLFAKLSSDGDDIGTHVGLRTTWDYSAFVVSYAAMSITLTAATHTVDEIQTGLGSSTDIMDSNLDLGFTETIVTI